MTSKAEIRALYIEHMAALPSHMHEGVTAYIEHGREVGGFLTALFEGQLDRAKQTADHRNATAWDIWMDFMLKAMPIKSFGTPLKVSAWRKMGGLDGYPDGA